MHILIGLGNPGRDYARHRHNIGFMVMDEIASYYHLGGFKKKLNGNILEGRVAGQKIILVKPQTFMNKSGHCARNILDFYKLKAESVTVFYDELDLKPGKLKIKRGGGTGGHNGIKSLDAHIGQNYRRIRLGIGHPGHKDKVAGYVLHDFGSQDREWLEMLLPSLAKELPILLDGDEAKYSSKVLQALVPNSNIEGQSKHTNPAQGTARTSASSPAKPAHHAVKDKPTTALGQAFAQLLGGKK